MYEDHHEQTRDKPIDAVVLRTSIFRNAIGTRLNCHKTISTQGRGPGVRITGVIDSR